MLLAVCCRKYLYMLAIIAPRLALFSIIAGCPIRRSFGTKKTPQRLGSPAAVGVVYTLYPVGRGQLQARARPCRQLLPIHDSL